MRQKIQENPAVHENLGYGLGVMAVMAFSLTLPITKYLTPFLSIWDIGFGRSLLAAIVAAVILLACKQSWPSRSQLLKLCIVASGIAFGFPVLTAVGMQSAPSSWRGYPGRLALYAVGCFLSGERPSWIFWLVALSGFIAIALYSMVSAGATTDLALYSGDFALFGAVLFAGLGYAQGGLLARELGGWQVICWTLVVSLPLLVPLTWFYGDWSAFQALPLSGWAAFAFLAVINSLIGFFFWYKALALGGVTKISQVQLSDLFYPYLCSLLAR